MTVGELIEYLKQQPEDVEVLSYRDGLMNRAPEVLTAVDWDDHDTQDSTSSGRS